jgi:hypothetical protein
LGTDRFRAQGRSLKVTGVVFEKTIQVRYSAKSGNSDVAIIQKINTYSGFEGHMTVGRDEVIEGESVEFGLKLYKAGPFIYRAMLECENGQRVQIGGEREDPTFVAYVDRVCDVEIDAESKGIRLIIVVFNTETSVERAIERIIKTIKATVTKTVAELKERVTSSTDSAER